MKLGRHLSISKGIDQAIIETEKIGANSLPNYRRESLTHEMDGDESANQIVNIPLL
ncbi:MAG: hypothetical protein K9K32_01605 [Halanaerobiales bacterium]|nr:hypothetical protein [Halanaerobiales bacterium]